MNEPYHEERPWGSFTTLEEGRGYKVKRLEIKPGKRFSLQRHRHRSEHWTVVRGSAEITKGEESFSLSVNEGTVIPKGVQHRVYNGGGELLVIIEVQVGEYLGEDDIERLEDDFGRV